MHVLIGRKIGSKGQLTCVNADAKYAYVVCDICCVDIELHGPNPFRMLHSAFYMKQQPCGCSKSHRWTKEQYEILLSRKAESLGFMFNGFAEDFHGKTTKISLTCAKHGEWRSGIISNFLHRAIGCPECKRELVGIRAKKDDDEIIKKFKLVDVFHPDTIFKRSNTKDAYGSYLWEMHCPLCNQMGLSTASALKGGSKSCGCKKQNPTQAYINILKDGDLPIALKFGISKFSEMRLKEIKKDSVFEVENFAIFRFTNSEDCRDAESECLSSLDCGILTKRDIQNGFTETTHLYNIDTLVKIFENYGGIRMSSL
ncbi:hypothetical protein D3C85_764670 [compost metagenome]